MFTILWQRALGSDGREELHETFKKCWGVKKRKV